MNANPSLDHVAKIKALLLTLRSSERMHTLIVEGPAGWGKTTAVNEALKALNIKRVHLGAYSTSLNLFNFLHENESEFVIIDDCAGLFNDSASMAIMKAATWPQENKRIVRWGSTSGKANSAEFEFRGKLIIVCNTFPNSPDAVAVKSRSFPCRIELNSLKATDLIRKAALDRFRYPKVEKAKSVAEFLCSRLTRDSLKQINFRTLEMGYELALHNEDSWQDLLSDIVGARILEPKECVKRLSSENLKVKDQLARFSAMTGLKRRTFFKYRKELGINR